MRVVWRFVMISLYINVSASYSVSIVMEVRFEGFEALSPGVATIVD